MTTQIVNGAPMTEFQGTKDDSTQAAVIQPQSVPTHLAKVYLFAKQGPTDPQLVSGDSRTQMYGSDTFDLRKKWSTHTTVLSNVLNEAANAQMIERLIPPDAPPAANARIWLDVLPTQVPDYKRNTDGSYQLDPTTGLPIPTGSTLAGFKCKWVVTYIAPDQDGNSMIGQGTIQPGDQTDTTSNTQSNRIPFFDLPASFIGDAGNNNGIRFWAPTSASTSPPDDRIITDEAVYPFRVTCVQRATSSSSAVVVPTQDAEQYINFCLKPGTIDKNTDSQLYLGDVFFESWNNLADPSGIPPQYGPLGNIHIYQANVDEYLLEFYNAEFPVKDQWSDFTGAADEQYAFNVFTGVSSSNVPYHSFVLDTEAANAQRWTENTAAYMSGGGDGTMNETVLAELVATAVAKYADPTSPYQDMAKYPESIIYDSGFPIDTKYALADFMAIRKDTAVVLSTHDVLGVQLTASQESSLAVALRTRLQMYPESEYFGTPTMRACIIGRSGKMLSSQYTKPLPLVIEFAYHAAQYMGASNGVWNSTYRMDNNPNNIVSMFDPSSINVTWTPATVRNKDWDNGLVWVEQFDLHSLYWPAYKTVYSNDTSVLTSFLTMMACVELEKVGEKARRQYSGRSDLTDQQFADRINKYISGDVEGRFDSRFTIIPNTYYTTADQQRGYSWTTKIQIYADNMKTVQTLYLEAHRSSDLTTTATA